MDLSKERAEIDRIDKEMAALFEARMQVCREIGRKKADCRRPVRDRAREEERIASGLSVLSDKSLAKSYRAFAIKLMALSRKEQRALRKKAEK